MIMVFPRLAPYAERGVKVGGEIEQFPSGEGSTLLLLYMPMIFLDSLPRFDQ